MTALPNCKITNPFARSQTHPQDRKFTTGLVKLKTNHNSRMAIKDHPIMPIKHRFRMVTSPPPLFLFFSFFFFFFPLFLFFFFFTETSLYEGKAQNQFSPRNFESTRKERKTKESFESSPPSQFPNPPTQCKGVGNGIREFGRQY